ncbi:TrkH family potassium uptake protein [Zhaonella formicivorans]|uniref:TrkH family potassium uptake protein n=1 Tax=Zhaonella formicivorans TaxID=2528593 RepID=UPI0010DB73AE|nr:TrkH family potassium uptake protein [Zhaonella formicivorans]
MNQRKLSPPQILVLGFAGVILLGSILLSLPIASANGQPTPFLDALFTATSAVCVTGLVVVDTGIHWSFFGQIVILSLIQIGGLGFMTVATLFALLLGRKIGLRERLLLQEALNKVSVQGVVRLTRNVLLTTLIIEGVAAAILALRWIPQFGLKQGVWFGIFHAVSGFNNAGFDLFGQVYGPFTSITHYVADPVVTLTISFLIILGGLGFGVITDVIEEKRFSQFVLHTKLVLVTTAVLILGGTLVLYVLEFANPKTLQPLSIQGKILAAYFQAVTPRTAGYNSINIADMTKASQFLIILLMFIGASPGSTGGGIKTTTFASIMLGVWAVITGQEQAGTFERRLPKEQVIKAMSIAFIAFLLVTVVTMILSITESADFLTIIFETTSAFGTVGLTMGLTPNLTAVGRILIILTMFAGRVGPLTLAFAIALKAQKSAFKYPEEKILIG